MVKWVCYPTSDEPDMWTDWLRRRNAAVKGRHATVMRFLLAGHWEKPHFKMLRGGHLKGLGEIIIKTDVQWRLIGRYERSNETFTLTMICYHKERVYIPHDALEIAMERWKEMKNGLKGIMLNAHPT